LSTAAETLSAAAETLSAAELSAAAACAACAAVDTRAVNQRVQIKAVVAGRCRNDVGSGSLGGADRADINAGIESFGVLEGPFCVANIALMTCASKTSIIVPMGVLSDPRMWAMV